MSEEKQTNWTCGRLLSAGRDPGIPNLRTPWCSSAPKVDDLCSCCPRWNAWVPNTMGQKKKKNPLVAHATAGTSQKKVHYFIFSCKGQEIIIRKGDNTGFSLGKRKVSCKAKLLSLLWRLQWHSTSRVWAQSPHWDLFIPELSRFLGSAVIAGRRSHGEGGFS